MNVVIDVPTGPEFAAALESSPDFAQPLFAAAMTNSTREVQRVARSLAPHRTGTLQRSITAVTDYPMGQVFTLERYGIYMELGTKAHQILPKTKKALYWKGAPYPVKVVNHPGTKPRPFMQPAMVASQPYIQAQFEKVIQLVLERLT